MEEKKENTEQSSKVPKENNSRRNFLKIAGVAAGAAAVTATIGGIPLIKEVQAATSTNKANTTAIVPLAFYQTGQLSKFTEKMRGVYPLDPDGIPVAIPDTAGVAGVSPDHYKIDIQDYDDTLHTTLGANSTHLRGYHPVNQLGGSTAQRHLGGIILAKKGMPTQITFTNKLGSRPHPIPIDKTIMGASDGDNRAAVHLHGGFVHYISDGGPFSWFGPVGPPGSVTNYGPSVPKSYYEVLNPSITGGQAEYYYPNQQSARLVWYHDHTVGITRMNAYAGIASAYIIRDDFEASLVANNGLPDYIEHTTATHTGFELPIIIQDKVFVGANISTADPTWTGDTKVGSLWYAHTYDPKRWKLLGRPKTLPDPSVIPEFFGDTMLANGKIFPVAKVEARRYRLRILNACQARFLNLQLYIDDGTKDSITLTPATNTPTNVKGPDFLVIGTEGGFLPKPVTIPSNMPFNPLTLGGSLITAPAERWDVIVDFSGLAGNKVVLYNDAPAPFPIGDPRNDYFPMAPNNPTITNPGFGPNTRQIMQFDIVPATSADPPLTIDTIDLATGNDPLPIAIPRVSTALPTGVPVRRLTLNETFDALGRLIQMLGTDVAPVKQAMGFGKAYTDPVTETINLKGGEVDEIWQVVNLTGDTHPIHFHLVNVQIVSRQTFNVSKYNGGAPALTGVARLPDQYEQGWKETVRMNPGEVTNVYIRFKLPIGLPPGLKNLYSPRIGGYEYVWHCHILEHEEHDMMRPLVVYP
jgi:spore coat protein A, manganese oxidase